MMNAKFEVMMPAKRVGGPGAPIPDPVPVHGGHVSADLEKSIEMTGQIGGARFGIITILSGAKSGGGFEGCAYTYEGYTVPGFGRLVIT